MATIEIKSGVYETIYGNAVEVNDNYCYDLDMGMEIPFELVDFNCFIRNLSE